MKTKKPKYQRQIASTFLLSLTLVVILASGLVLRKQLFQPKAASTCKVIAAQVSTDGKNPSLSITLPAGRPTKYYLHVKTGTAGCESAFDISSQVCDNGKCGGWSSPAAWGTYRSNSQGITRLDLDGPWPANRVVNMKVKPRGTSYALSNPVKVSFSSKAAPAKINMSDYYVFKPGYVWEYKSINHKTGGTTGNTRIQIENETTFCGIRFYPWRFTKDKSQLYWGPIGNRNLRWFIVNPSFKYSAIPSYNNHIWGFGNLDYQNYTLNNRAGTFDPVSGLRDIAFEKMDHLIMYKNLMSKNTLLPSYNLSPKQIPSTEPYIGVQNESSYVPNWPYHIPTYPLTTTSCNMKWVGSEVPGQANIRGSWKIRIEKDTLPGWGEVIRTDQYEGGPNMEKDGLLRESWYFAKNVGLVKLVTKRFNNYGNDSSALPCSEDSDCWSDTITKPWTEMTLANYYQNPKLSATVSSNGSSYASSITTTQDQGYYLKITPAYTGYLEANTSGNIQKWLWAEKGIVKVPNATAPGTYTSSFRVWVPNEKVVGETRINPVNIAWSNPVTVKVNPSANCQTNTWYTTSNYSGLNWCYANGNVCASDWASNMQIYVSCPGQRVQNIGTYCARSNGTKSFVGRSTCVK